MLSNTANSETFIQADDEVDDWWEEQWVEYYAAELSSLAEGKAYYDSERADTRVDGNPFVSRSVCFLVAGYEDSWERVITIHQDITDRKRMEEQLRLERSELEQQLRAFFRNSDTNINIKDTDGRFVLVSRQYEKTFGLLEEEAHGKYPHELYPEDFAEHVRRHDLAVLREGRLLQ